MSLIDAVPKKSERRASAERLYEHHEDRIERELPSPEVVVPAAASAPASPRATADMCAFCFAVIVSRLEGRAAPAPPFPVDISCPFFVTWEKHSGSGKRWVGGGSKEDFSLRGCIGTLSPQPLSRLADYACTSAFNDRRFSPIDQREVARLKCSVSLLVEYEDGEDAHDWEVGKHGILISFADSRGTNYSATYLPEIAHEQGWSKLEALQSLVRKSGYKGAVTEALIASIELTRYQSSKCSLHYTAYMDMRA